MKTAMKITALAVITVLVTLSCVPEVSVTDRDYSEYNDAKSAVYTSNHGGTGVALPQVNTYVKFNTSVLIPQSEGQKEIAIILDPASDILKLPNADIPAKLQEFFSFLQYSNAATAPLPVPPATSTYYVASTVTAIPYTFVRREGNTGDTLVVKLNSIPDRPYITWKLDASKYYVSGQLVDFNGDGKAGEAFDDIYGEDDGFNDTRIDLDAGTDSVTAAGTLAMGYTTDFSRPDMTFNLSISGFLSNGNFYAGALPEVVPIFQPSSSPNVNVLKILNDIKDKVELQKYNNGTWVKDGSIAVFDGDSTSTTLTFTTDTLYVTFTPSNLGIYRLKVTGGDELVSTVGAVKVKIIVESDPYSKTRFYDPVAFYNIDFVQPLPPVSFSLYAVKINSDHEKRNVVLDVYFQGVVDNILATTPNVYPATLTLENFNKAAKLVYKRTSGTFDLPGVSVEAKDYVELPVVDVAYKISKQYSSLNTTDNNLISITLDPSYQIAGDRNVYLLLSPDFKFAQNHVTPGNFTGNIKETFYNGSFFWENYGILVNGL